LKPSFDFQYSLNAKGSSPAELLGLSYKTELKPALKSYAEENKRISTSKLDESVYLQKQLQENVKILEEKKNNISSLQGKVDKVSSSYSTNTTLHFTVELF
jgi:kinetochore protein NDC80